MRRSSRRRRSSIDAFIRRAIILIVAVAFLLFSFGLLASEQPLVATLLLVGSVGFAVWLWRRRRRARRLEARRRVLQVQRLGELLTMSPVEFESAIAEIFRALGYRNVSRIGGSGDLGVDLAAVDTSGLRVIVQCKRYGPGNKIGSPAIQSFIGMVVHHDVDRGIFVTTSEFTGPAVQLAQTSRVPIWLIDRNLLPRLAEQAHAGAPPVLPSNEPKDGHGANEANGRGGTSLTGACSQCGMAYAAADTFCAFCGAPLGSQAEAAGVLGPARGGDHLGGRDSSPPVR